ncbi:MAG TPA: hypothetical protein VL651_12475 [Bacteroidia bacterium]|jgi:hypothetical protein|nr:hypothetical protein [Bacteroidia bacterium]
MILKAGISEAVHWSLILFLLLLGIFFIKKKQIRKAGVTFLSCFTYVMLALFLNGYTGKLYVINQDFSCSVYYVWGNSQMELQGNNYKVDPDPGKILIINSSKEKFVLTRVEYGNAHDADWRDLIINGSETKKADISAIDILPDMKAPPSVMLPPGEGLVQYKLYRILR